MPVIAIGNLFLFVIIYAHNEESMINIVKFENAENSGEFLFL